MRAFVVNLPVSQPRAVICSRTLISGRHCSVTRLSAIVRSFVNHNRKRSSSVVQPPGAPSVLLLDPFREEAEMYEEYLRTVGFRVRVVMDAPAALDVALREPPDVAVVRVRDSTADPDRTGIAARLKAAAITRHVRVILLTTSEADAERSPTMHVGCDTVLLLPTLPDDLVAEMRRLLNEAHP